MCKGTTIKKEETVEETVVDDKGDFKNFKINDKMIKKLEERSIKALFPIQYMTYNHIYEKKDVIAQAKTGTGKTLGFSLPVMCRLQKKEKPLKKGRKPEVIVLAPTRELVGQIAKDFESLIYTNMKVLTVYGGVPYHKQTEALRAGVDVIVGAPGRLRDLINQGCLDLSEVKFVILDEVDCMLDMGFSDIVDEILSYVYPGPEETERKAPQTLLFSATMPGWIKNMVSKYLKSDAVNVCLIKSNDSKAAVTVEHLALMSAWRDRSTKIADCIRVYAGGAKSRSIVFCERKKDADELAAHADMGSDCHVLHGDVPQEKRELVLKKFREGKYNTLVTTNVASRGLDIPDVELVIQCHPPKDVEDYIHRSGRTGRAGRKGVCILFYEHKERADVQRVERMAGFTFRQIQPPSAAAVAASSLADTVKLFHSIPESAITMFMGAAAQLIEEFGAEKAMALALAKMAGKMEEQVPKSLLTCKEGFTTYVMRATEPVKFKGYVYNNLKKHLSEAIVESVKSLQFVKDRLALVFDLPSEHNETVAANWVDNEHHTLAKIDVLPELEVEMAREGAGGFRQNGGGDRNGGGHRGFGGNGGGFGQNRGSFGGGFKRKNEGGFGGSANKVIKFD